MKNLPFLQIVVYLLAAHSLVAAPPIHQAPEPLPPEIAAKSSKVPLGFSVTLFAAEPDVLQPVALCLDDRGRLWVAENHSYPNHTDQPAQDRILILEDTDGDGRFDERTVFYDKLNYVSGIEVGFGGAWVMSPPYFYFIPDRDGDDVPDAEPKPVLDGFGNFANSHNIANGFAWGPDGWLYATHGRTNWSMIGRPGAEKNQRSRFDGGVWRYHPVRDVWEPYADGCTNPWGIDWDDFGEAFIPNTVNPHLFHVIQGAHYEPWRNRESSRFAYERIETIADHLHFLGERDIRAGLLSDEEMALGGGHSHCGILVYLGDQFPDRFRNTVFLHNTHGRRINHDTLERKGSGYNASHLPDLVISEDPWFMGVNFRLAPDGSVYYTDWSDTGECHSTRNTRKHTGRIFKLSYGKPETTPVDLASRSNAELVALQLEPNDWYVRHARRLLHERASHGQPMDEVHAQLRAILRDHEDVTRKLRALWALFVTGGTDEALLTTLLDHESEYLRGWGIKLLGEDRNPPEAARKRFVELAANGESPHVRLQLASLLQRLDPAARWKLGTALAARGEDRDDQNLPLMIWYGLEPLVHADAGRFAGLIETAEIPLLQRHIARRIASLPEPGPGLEAVLDQLAGAPRPVQSEIVDGLLQGLEGRTGLATPANWPKAEAALATHPGFALKALELGALFNDPATFAKLRALAEDTSAPDGDRIQALQRLVGSKTEGLAPWLLDRLEQPVLRRHALRGLAQFDHPETPDAILAAYPSWTGLETRHDALQTLASRRPWAAAMLDALEAGTIDPSDLTAYTSRQIANLGDGALTQRIETLWGTVRETPAEKRKRIRYHVNDLSDELDQADLVEGRRLYKQLCAACHKLFDDGGNIGPEITGAQRSSVEYLVENIIDPSGSVARDYQMQIIELTDGRTLTGFISAETETTLTIRTLNEELVTPRDAIAKQTVSPVSIMPEGLFDAISETQIRHLIGYLMSPTQVPLPPQ